MTTTQDTIWRSVASDDHDDSYSIVDSREAVVADYVPSKALADLIAAGPALLEACIKQSALIEGLRDLLTFYRIGKRPTEKTLNGVQGASEVQDLARAAIARATGANETT